MKKLAALTLASSLATPLQAQVPDNYIQQYVSRRIPEIMLEQREKFGMRFPAYPKVAYKDVVNPYAPHGWVQTGRYDSVNDTIELHKWFLERPGFFSTETLDSLL